jgi:hypothetical protein
MIAPNLLDLPSANGYNEHVFDYPKTCQVLRPVHMNRLTGVIRFGASVCSILEDLTGLEP